MARAFAEIAFTPAVREQQEYFGSAKSYARMLGTQVPRGDRLGAAEAKFISEIDGFYQASVNSDGWPYVQFRGGPAGFLRVVDETTIAYADYRGNRQYLSIGNFAGEDRVALILMDYAHRRRLKIWGRAGVVRADDDPGLVSFLHDPAYRAIPESAVVISIEALDWNCPAHIPERLTVTQLGTELSELRGQVAALTDDNRALRTALSHAK